MCKRCVSISDNDKTVYVIVFSYLDNYILILWLVISKVGRPGGVIYVDVCLFVLNKCTDKYCG